MHGRPRRALTAAESAASAAKSAKLRDLQTQLLHNHENKLYTKEAVLTSAKLLEINPEVYTAWNYRKLALQHNLEGLGDAEIVKSLVDDELRTVEMALRWNPKSYGPWHHRKWVLSQRLSEADFGREFRLLDQLLKADPRNFHGWNYRRFIAKLKNVSEVEELKFTMDMINTNFSNYSAWHSRSALLSQLLKQKAEGFDTKENILTEEYELVRQALFTDPSDQSGWFYHLWLLDQTVTLDYPMLISSWPSQGSDWVLSINANCFKLSPSVSSNCHYSLYMGTLPIILYFNQAVSGVNSSTVTVNSIFPKNEELIWRPLTTNKSREAHCWVTDLKISDAEFENSKSSTVEVSIGHSCCIISSSGSHYPHSSQLKFTITVKFIYKETTEEPVEELVMWNDVKKELVHENDNEIYFDKLSITKEHEPRVSKWNLETLSNEIELFKELSEENCKFVNLTLARLLSAQDSVTSQGNILMHKRTHSQEVLELFNDLVKLDPSHARYYEDERSLLIMNQSTLDVKAIMKHYLQSCELTTVSLCHAGLRLSRLSLTRIGCVERLLWIQTIDLSHNELRSITGFESPTTLMATKVKGFFKSFKYISQIFVYKEHEMEIGYPTDVRHVAHVGWDSSSMNAPSWMNEFRTASDFSSSSLSNYGQSRETSWASQDFDQPRGFQPPSGIPIDFPRPDVPKPGKKSKRKKGKNSSSLSSTSSRSVKSQASYTTAVEDPEEVRSEYRLF